MSPEEALEYLLERTLETVEEDGLRRAERLLNERVDDLVDRSTSEEQLAILEAFGDRDLSESGLDLRVGWPRIRAQLTFNALHAEVMKSWNPPPGGAPDVESLEEESCES